MPSVPCVRFVPQVFHDATTAMLAAALLHSFQSWVEPNMLLEEPKLQAMCRGGEREGSFEMLEMETYPDQPQEAGAAFKTRFSWTANGKAFSKGTSLYYKPPCLLRYFPALWHCKALQ